MALNLNTDIGLEFCLNRIALKVINIALMFFTKLLSAL